MMENEISYNDPADKSVTLSALVEAEKSRAVQEVQAALVIAKRFPRDHNAVYARIMQACQRKVLAEQAMYSFPRGGQVVTGPSIRMAEILAQNYGNLDFGIRELERRGNVSVAESYCWDMETNTRQTKVFEVPHEIELKGGKKKKLTDPRDIYELVANNGARRMRACILGIIPGDLVEAAVDQCRKTVAKGSGEPMADRIRKMVTVFKEMGVSQEMVAEKLGHSVDLITAEEIVELTAIYTSIRDKQAKRGDFFNFKDEDGLQDAKASALSEKLKEQPK
jgi:hypothetical protein